MADTENIEMSVEEMKEDWIEYIRNNINDKGVVEYLRTYTMLASNVWIEN